MQTTLLSLLLLAQVALTASPPTDAAPQDAPSPVAPLVFRHRPVVESKAGQAVILRAEATPAWRVAAVVVHHRILGGDSYRQTPFERSAEGGFVAVLPAEGEGGQHLEYFLTGRLLDGVEEPLFAARADPQLVRFQQESRVEEKQGLLRSYGDRRSRVGLFAEYVDYGSHLPRGTQQEKYEDWYYRTEADFLFRLFERLGPLRIDSIRIGMGHMRARTPPASAFGLGPLSGELEIRKGGWDYGFSEIDLSFHRLVGLCAKLMLGAAQDFTTGAGIRLRIGPARGSRVELEGERVGGLGTTGAFRLAWDTVPRVPMSATLQITNLPSGPAGIRVLYRADWEMTGTFTLGAQLGYQARRAVGGGLTTGLSTAVAW